MTRRLFVTGLAALLLLSSAAVSATLELARNGKSAFRIYVPAGSSQNVLASADTLAKYIFAVSGATIPISSDVKTSGYRIVLQSGINSDSSGRFRDLGNDGFLLKTSGKTLYLVAQTDYGIQNAVYTFLESYLGCRLYSPTVRIIPRTPTIGIPEMNDRQVPQLTFRMQDMHDSTYLTWHKLNTHDRFGLFVHTFQILVPAGKYFKDHPEYFSLLKGNRTPTGQLCLTNPDVFRVVCDELRARMKANPQATFWSVSQNDTYVPCECASCRAIDSVEGSPSGSILTFVNRVADEFPNMTISTLAYQYSRSAPRHLKPRPNVNIMLCSIECNRSKPLAEDPSSVSFVKDVEDWSRLTHNIFLWDYVIQYRNLVSPFPNLRILQPNIQFFARNGITSVFEQGLPGFGGEFSELRTYLIAKLLWDPDMNFDSVMNDFLRGYYGNAAPYIRQYIDTMHTVLQASGESLDIYGYPTRSANGYLSSAMLDVYGSIFDQAEAAVIDLPDVLARVRTARLPLQFAILEQAKVAATDEGGCFVRNADGTLAVRGDFDSLLSMFVRRCKEVNIPRLWEYGTAPDAYFRSTRAFLDAGTRRHLARGASVTLAQPASTKYHSGDKTALTDGLKGWDDYRMHWLGFEGEEMDATVDLGTLQSISSIRTDFLQEINSWVFLPDSVTFSISGDGNNYQVIQTVIDSIPSDRDGKVIAPFDVTFAPVDARYVRVQTHSKKICPTWHKGSGGLAWIFIDEITVE